MPSESIISTGEVVEGNDWFLTYRIVRPDGTVVSDADIAEEDAQLTVKVFLQDTQAAVADDPLVTTEVTGANTKTNHIMIATASDALITDGFWNGVDSTGYNFFYKQVANSTDAPWIKGGQRYRIEFTLTIAATNAGSSKGNATWGNVCWASIIYVKPMVS